MDLARLIDPISTETFRRDYWEKQPLVIRRQDPLYYRDLLSLADVDAILASSSVASDNLRVVHEGVETPIAQLLASDRAGRAGGLELLYERYRQGSTIVLNALHERWPSLARLCRALATELSAGLQVNVYLTPRGARGLRTHYDTHDVFVVQVEGAKHWRLYRSPLELPLASQPYERPTEGPGEPVREFDLQAGDLIYIPRGFVHDATSNETMSLHLTVGIRPVTWAALLGVMVQSALAEDARFREALPPGYVDDPGARQQVRARFAELVAALASSPRLSSEAALEQATTRAILERHPVLEGHLVDLEEEPSLSLDTRLRRRPEIQWRLVRDDGRVALEFHGKVVRLPGHVEEEMRHIAGGEAFSARHLPGELDESGRLVLVRSLLREGFVTHC